MKALYTLFILLFGVTSIIGQDCFMPPSGYTLYTSGAAIEDTTGFVSISPDYSGDWSVLSTTGTAGANFIDDDGRTSTLAIGGEGTITVQNISTNVVTKDVVTCEHEFRLAPYAVSRAINPPISGVCPIDIVLVLDESGSIAANMSVQTVRDAAMNLVNGLSGTGSRIAIIEFDSQAERVPLGGSTDLQFINSTLVGQIETYLTTGYDPVGDALQLVGGTNWEDALEHADDVGADLVLMVTDGRPTFYNTTMGPNGQYPEIAGEGLRFDLTALYEANAVANRIKEAGTHMFVAGLDFPADIGSIIDITGTNEYVLGDDINELYTSDYTIIDPSQLGTLFAELGASCEIELVPTMGEWAVINLLLLLMIFGVVSIKQRATSLG